MEQHLDRLLGPGFGRWRVTILVTIAAAMVGSALPLVAQAALRPALAFIVPQQQASTTPRHRIRQGIPYQQLDGDVVQWCVSSKDAWSLPPFITRN